MAFDEVQFPPDIAWGATGGPGFSTGVLTTTLGYEFRNRQWSASLAKYDVSHATRTQAEMDILVAFYRARNGTVRGFRFKDWMDFKLTMNPASADGIEALGVGDTGVANQILGQLQKTYSDAESTYIRVITKPVVGTVELDTTTNGVASERFTYDTGTIATPNEDGDFFVSSTGEIQWTDHGDDGNSVVSSVVGTTTLLGATPSFVAEIGMSVYITGETGTAAALINNKRWKVIGISGPRIEINVDTSGLTILHTGTFHTYPHSSETFRVRGFEFDVPVRFEADKMAVTIDSFENYSADKITLVEVRDPSISVAQTEPTNTFHHVRLDPKITFGATGAPRFKNNVFTTTGGHTARLSPWDEDRPEYDVSEGLKDFEDFQNILDFFYARYGKAYGFRFRDWQDYNMSGTEGGVDQTPDGIIGLFNLAKKYVSGDTTFFRQITAPIEPNEEIVSSKYGSQQSAPDFVITVDGVDVDHDANAQFFDINGRTVRDTAGAITGISHGTMDFGLTLRDGQSGADNIINITGITKATTAVVTHTEDSDAGVAGTFIQGFTTGETVYISGIAGMTEVNDRRFKITKLTDFTFELDGEDSTLHTAFSGDGVATKLPQSGEEVVVTGDFDVPVRFATDDMAFTHENYGFHSWGGIPLEGIRLK